MRKYTRQREFDSEINTDARKSLLLLQLYAATFCVHTDIYVRRGIIGRGINMNVWFRLEMLPEGIVFVYIF